MNVSSLEGGGGNKWYPWLWINIFEAISLSNTTLSIRCLISRNRDGWYNINGRKRNINALAGGQSHEKCTEATRAAYVIFAWGIKRLFANEKCPSLKRSNAVGLGYHIYIFRENIVRGFASLSNGDLIKYSLWSVRRSTRVSPCFPVYPARLRSCTQNFPFRCVPCRNTRRESVSKRSVRLKRMGPRSNCGGGGGRGIRKRLNLSKIKK